MADSSERGAWTQSVSLDEDDFWVILHFHARGAARNLVESWERPVRHNKKLERLALWHTVELDRGCEYFMGKEPDMLPRLPQAVYEGGSEARYEVQAALHVIPKIVAVPFVLDRYRLRQRQSPDEILEAWGENMAKREPVVVARWHDWLWSSHQRMLRTEPSYETGPDDYGDSSMLMVAASRLAEALEPVVRSSLEPK
jgi:hypothetical protein